MRLIDADALKYKRKPNTSNTGGNNSLRYCSYEDVQNTPTVDAEPIRHGHWIKSKDNTILAPCYECSVCGRKINTWGIASETAPYCHCGAKMDEEVDNGHLQKSNRLLR